MLSRVASNIYWLGRYLQRGRAEEGRGTCGPRRPHRSSFARGRYSRVNTSSAMLRARIWP